MSSMREKILQRLKDLDEEASLLFRAERLHLIIVGGGALVLLEVVQRSTHDIDALAASKQLHKIMGKYDINTQVLSYANNFPFNYEDRILPVKEIQGKIIDFYTASLEDIVVAKLCSYRDTDIQDITSEAVINNLDWDKLHQLATAEDELRSSGINDFRYREFLDGYYDYIRRYKPCRN